jgi:hypothetical protein
MINRTWKNTQLFSDTLVEELVCNEDNYPAFIVGIISETSIDCASFYENDDDERIIHNLKIIHGLHESHENGSHYGDCTKEAISCMRCHTESKYVSGTEIIEKMNGKYSIEEIVAILLFSEIGENNIIRETKSMKCGIDRCDDFLIFGDIEEKCERYEKCNNKLEYILRAKNIITLFKNEMKLHQEE